MGPWAGGAAQCASEHVDGGVCGRLRARVCVAVGLIERMRRRRERVGVGARLWACGREATGQASRAWPHRPSRAMRCTGERLGAGEAWRAPGEPQRDPVHVGRRSVDNGQGRTSTLHMKAAPQRRLAERRHERRSGDHGPTLSPPGTVETATGRRPRAEATQREDGAHDSTLR